MEGAVNHRAACPRVGRDPIWLSTIFLTIWLVAGVVAFLPFARNTSPWDAVTLRVPGNQGNWWHVLVGAPFFLAYPMIWLRLRSLFSARPSTPTGRRLMWSAVALSMGSTILVELPFLLHLAGTSDWQRFVVLSLGFGITAVSVTLLLLRRRYISSNRACLIGLDAAYLANAALCLVVYSGAPGDASSKLGWQVSMMIVWPIALELIWFLTQIFQTPRE
jgi:hypothetical protein